MADWVQMRPREELHRTIVCIHVIQREPRAHEVCRCAAPIGIVLVPVDGTAMIGWLVESLVVEQLDVGANEIFDDIEDALVVELAAKMDVALTHLHNL